MERNTDRKEEQNSRVQLVLTDKAQPVELTAEITLPDYRSEISRLLWVRPVLLPPARFVGGGKVDLSGPVRYQILYVGPDGVLYGAESEEGYAFSVPMEPREGMDSGEGAELSVDIRPDAVVSRVTGPRKLSVRCRALVRLQGYADKLLTPKMQGAGEPYRLCEAVENGRVTVGDTVYFDLADSVETDADMGEIRVIGANGTVFLPDAVAAEGCVRCRGEAVISVLACADGDAAGVPFVLTRRIPFERELPVAGAAPDCRARVMGTVGEVRTTVEEGRIALEADVSLRAELQGEDTAVICRDAYLQGHSAACKMSEVPLWRAGPCGNRHFSVSGERLASEMGVPADAEVLYSVADAEAGERESKEGRTVISGQLRCHTLYRREGEYAVAEMAVPFRTVWEEDSDGMELCCTVSDCRVRLSGESLRADAELQICARGYTHAPARVLSEVSFTPADPAPRADMEICYPAPGESLWEVGKRYGVSPDSLAQANGLGADAPGETDSLADVKYLLIP